MDESKLLSIGETSKALGVSVDTIRRWDREGKFSSVRSAGGHRYFRKEDVDNFLFDIFGIARKWVTDKDETDIPSNFYCQTSSVFQARLSRFESELGNIPRLKDFFPLISSLAGEIGNNSFDHNIGNWPGMPGIFFGYDVNRGRVVLADRGQGVYKTLKRVRPELSTDQEALHIAFTEIISGRAPESRGNGLKFVRRIVTGNAGLNFIFKAGDATLIIKGGDDGLLIQESETKYHGCFVQLTF